MYYKKYIGLFLILLLTLFGLCGCDSNGDVSTNYNLTIAVEGNGEVSPAEGTHVFTKNTEVQLEATPEAGWEFIRWSGGIDETTNPFTIIMDSDIYINAVFSEIGKVNQPNFSPSPGTYNEIIDVNISCDTQGATIYYTTDGTDPDQSSTEYTLPITLSEGTTVIKAKAYKNGLEASDIKTADYTVTLAKQEMAFLSYRDGKGIYKVNINDSSATEVEKIVSLNDDPEYGMFEAIAPDWSSGNEKIVYCDEDSQEGDFEVFLINSNGTNKEKITNNNTREIFATISPDGLQVAFESYRHDTEGEIYRRNLDGSIIKRLTVNDVVDMFPDWSPDGSRIVFSSYRNNILEIYHSDLNGDDVQRLTVRPDTEEIDPTWSPDGNEIAFISYENNNYENKDLFIMDSNGENIEKITDIESDVRTPSWSPDGKEILFASDLDGDYDIYKINIETKARTQLTSESGFDGYPVWLH
ncbi:MAG: chitobiase/beta-hexosaminidase C-terminal domain-containing protein [Halanaerobiales bacterium]|nr:chitobiase/beta-hexosaminidase C-terminal domain-containing protein [Halanaerobiales bacterium]